MVADQWELCEPPFIRSCDVRDYPTQHRSSLHRIVNPKNDVFSHVGRRPRPQDRGLDVAHIEGGSVRLKHWTEFVLHGG
jgi:hypothetical protein